MLIDVKSKEFERTIQDEKEIEERQLNEKNAIT